MLCGLCSAVARWTSLWTDGCKSLRSRGRAGPERQASVRRRAAGATSPQPREPSLRSHSGRGAPAGVEHGGVVASSELASDSRQGGARELAGQVHGDLPRPRDASLRRWTEALRRRARSARRPWPGSRRWCSASRPRRYRRADRALLRTSCASAASSGRPVSELKATTRMSAPSSARTLFSMRSAITCRARSSASCTPS